MLPNSTELPETAEVAIVGAGPAGLTLAATLAAAGVDAVLLDRLPAPQTTSRAAAVHARTLEALEALEVSPRLVAAGRQTSEFIARERDEVLLRISFAELPTRYPYVLLVPQNETEAILAARLGELGGRVHRGCEATGLAQDGAGVVLRVRDAGGAERTLRAAYVVGADGYHSRVREAVGIAMETGTYAQSFVLGDVVLDGKFGEDDAAQVFMDRAGLLLVVRLPHGRHRIIATVDEAQEDPDAAALQSLLDARGPSHGSRLREVAWASRFRVHHGVAARFRAGRVFLAGDAAHVHSPAGGQGMNIGIQDAVQLGRRLAAVLREGAAPATLDAYEAERRPVAERIVRQTDRLTRMLTLEGKLQRTLRNWAIEIVGHLPGIRGAIARQFAEIDDRPDPRKAPPAKDEARAPKA
jgi:2-polyprenyl-6-methoxyphenol hydroxylase-like FAD-dependent oxidoreductase